MSQNFWVILPECHKVGFFPTGWSVRLIVNAWLKVSLFQEINYTDTYCDFCLSTLNACWLWTSWTHLGFLLLSEMDWTELFSIIRSNSRGWNTSQRNKRSGFDCQWFSIAPDTSTDDVFLLIPPLVVSAPSLLVYHDSDFAGLQLHGVFFFFFFCHLI